MVEYTDGAAIRPAQHAAVVVPSDSVDLAVPSRLVMVGTGGDLRVTMVGGEIVTVPNVPPGDHPIQVRRIHSTGTDASDITVFW